MAAKKKSSDTANLDSFLDTLFNVAGILVIIIALTQITAKEKIKKDLQSNVEGGVSKEDIAKAEEKLIKMIIHINNEKGPLEEKTNEFEGLANQNSSLDSNITKIEEVVLSHGLYIAPSVLQTNLNKLVGKESDLNKTLAEAQGVLEDIRNYLKWSGLRGQHSAVKVKLDGNQTELNKLRGLVADGEMELNATRQFIHSRTLGKAFAQKGKEREGLENEVGKQKTGRDNLEKTRDDLEEKLEQAEYGKVFKEKDGEREDLEGQANAKQKALRDLRNKQKELADNLKAAERWPGITRLPRPREQSRGLKTKYYIIKHGKVYDEDDVRPNNRKVQVLRERGETLEEAMKENSDYRRRIGRLIKGGNFVYFWVYEDSFHLYAALRNVVERRGIEAGWVPMLMKEDLYYGGGGNQPGD